ncbi:hypothetical protein [Streptomyces sp. NPDC029674]|uniref:hypothetical protein n=1 Tax=Streptomyces sp. NPDC029674 TaxID=3365297 RepID=UPI00384B8F54
MSGVLIFAIIMAVVFVAVGLADQRKMWWRFRARWYRNPEANEPSDAAMTGMRVLFFVGAALLVFAGCQAQEAQNDMDRIEQEMDSPYGLD